MPKNVKLTKGVRYLATGYVNLKRKQRLSLISQDAMHDVRKSKAGKNLKVAYQEFIRVGTSTFDPKITVTMEHFKDGKWAECKYRVMQSEDRIRVWGESGGKEDFNDCLTDFLPLDL